MKKPAFAIVVSLEFIVIIYLISVIVTRLGQRKNVLSSFSESPISKENLSDIPDPSYKYYQEFSPGRKVIDRRSWLNSPVTYNINAETLNDRFDYKVEKNPGVFRIVALGDSFTFGQLVNTSESWPEVLEDMLRSEPSCKKSKFDVLNLGMMGFGVEYISHRYDLHGKKYNPDLIIWFEAGSGFERINELVMPMIEKARSEMSEEEIKNASDSGTFPDWETGFKEFHQRYTDEQIADSVGESWRRFLIGRGQVKVLVATFSSISQSKRDLLQSWISGGENVLFYERIPWVGFVNGKLKDGHPNPEGHKIIASHIFDYLKNRTIVPCAE